LPVNDPRCVERAGFPIAVYSTTANGWIESGAFLEYMKTVNEFVTKKQLQPPVVMFVDEHLTHISLIQVILFDAVKSWQMDNTGVVLLKRELPAVFKTAWTKVTIFTTSASAFRRAGMFPFCPNAIDLNRLHPVQIAAR